MIYINAVEITFNAFHAAEIKASYLARKADLAELKTQSMIK